MSAIVKKTKHTPGPWTTRQMREEFERWAVESWGWDATDFGRSDDDAYIWPQCEAAWDGWKACYQLNARLIAAAPELLEALCSALFELSRVPTGGLDSCASTGKNLTLRAEIEAVIRKAQGEA